MFALILNWFVFGKRETEGFPAANRVRLNALAVELETLRKAK